MDRASNYLTLPYLTNKQKLLVVFHVILDYTRNSVYLFQIPGGKYINDIFSDDKDNLL